MHGMQVQYLPCVACHILQTTVIPFQVVKCVGIQVPWSCCFAAAGESLDLIASSFSRTRRALSIFSLIPSWFRSVAGGFPNLNRWADLFFLVQVIA